jgi:hypothetical protein
MTLNRTCSGEIRHFYFFCYEKNVVFRIFTPNMKGFFEKKNKKNFEVGGVFQVGRGC